MRAASTMRAIPVALIASGVLTSCDASPTGPTSDRKPGNPVISGVQIVGPGAVPPGGTVKFTLVVTLSDRTTRDVTKEANWTSADGQVVSIAAPGELTGRERGTVMIEARFEGHRARKELYILPTGTYRLAGHVNDRADSQVPLAGARIEVTTGAGAGLVATTNPEGVFSLYGVAGDTTLRVTKPGYSEVTQTITVGAHQWINIALPFLGKYPDLSGTYTLTIAAASECGIGLGERKLPQDVRVRSYTAIVQQDGPSLWVALDGPTFRPEYPQGFYGSVQSAGVTFQMKNPDDGQGIAERLSTSKVLMIEGNVVAASDATTRIAGMLSGEFRLLETPSWKPIAWCSSTSHQFVLSRSYTNWPSTD